MTIKILDPMNFRRNADAHQRGLDIDKSTIVVGECEQEALDKGLKYYLIPTCPNQHKIALASGAIKLLTISLAGNGVEDCVVCNMIAKNSRKRTPAQVKQVKTRRSIELILEARELGISVEELAA